MPDAPADLPDRPRLAPGVRLHFDAVRGAWMLLAPERVIETEGPASDILRRCDGSRTVSEIIDEPDHLVHRPAGLTATRAVWRLPGR